MLRGVELFTSPATGRTYYIDRNGLAIAITPDAEEEYIPVCECEMDWNCGLCGGTSRPTWIERRYSDTDGW